MRSGRTGEAYRDVFKLALEYHGFDVGDVLVGLSDHEGAVRKAMRLLGAYLLIG